jgi:hypothetical protein
MAGLEATLRITAKDDATGAFKQIKDQISALDKQISTFDKLAAAAGKVGKAADPMIASINKKLCGAERTEGSRRRAQREAGAVGR